ncbi:hypothetical protein FRC12_021624 [Ceratobasidium sp. 428]|nr:hypothetical protein FRC12_021624 [Ceratobasidium sp. 428]
MNYDLVKRPKRARLGLLCNAHLDGIGLEKSNILTPPDINAGKRGFWQSVSSNGGRREFLFGKLGITDQEDLAPLEGTTVKDLNTTKIKIRWVNGCKKIYHDEDSESADDSSESSDSSDAQEAGDGTGNKPPARWVNEQLAHKGHCGSAELGPLIPGPSRTSASTWGKRKKEERRWHWEYQTVDSPPSFFIFHYAPKGRQWLQDKGIARQPAVTPVVDLINTQPQPQLIRNESVDVSRSSIPPPGSHEEQEGAAPIDNITHGHSIQPKSEPLTITAQEEQLASPQQGVSLANNAAFLGQDNNIDRDEKALLLPPAHPSIFSPRPQQPSPGSNKLRVKREREPTPPSFEVISSDDEIIVLDIKPPKRMAAKRPRVKSEDRDVKPVLEAPEQKPSIFHHQEIDSWRLGC